MKIALLLVVAVLFQDAQMGNAGNSAVPATQKVAVATITTQSTTPKVTNIPANDTEPQNGTATESSKSFAFPGYLLKSVQLNILPMNYSEKVTDLEARIQKLEEAELLRLNSTTKAWSGFEDGEFHNGENEHKHYHQLLNSRANAGAAIQAGGVISAVAIAVGTVVF